MSDIDAIAVEAAAFAIAEKMGCTDVDDQLARAALTAYFANLRERVPRHNHPQGASMSALVKAWLFILFFPWSILFLKKRRCEYCSYAVKNPCTSEHDNAKCELG